MAWAFAITNFVFWVGIGHAGTLISAILFLFRQKWRTSINRFAEAMTIFAVVCAGVFPAIHVGRVWYVFYWLFPYPNQMAIWPNFLSPLLWDVFAVSTYATVSLLFWYLGMVPDLATLRDRATTTLRRLAYGIFGLGWRGSAAGIGTSTSGPICCWPPWPRRWCFRVHRVVSFDFAVSQVPGWHTTIFPPYFVAGAIFSGFAMVVTLVVPARGLLRPEGPRHPAPPRQHGQDHPGHPLHGRLRLRDGVLHRLVQRQPLRAVRTSSTGRWGPMRWAGWTMVICNVVVPHLFWFRKCRTTPWMMVAICVLVNVGMWFERFVIIVTSLSRDFLPSSWRMYVPTWVDLLTLLGSFGLFFTLFLLFCRYLPMVAMAEVKSVLPRHEKAHEAPPESELAVEPALEEMS